MENNFNLNMNYLDLLTLLSKMEYKYDEQKDTVYLRFDNAHHPISDIKEQVLVNGNVKIRYLSEKEPISIIIYNFKNTIQDPEIKQLLGTIPPEFIQEVKEMFGVGGGIK